MLSFRAIEMRDRWKQDRTYRTLTPISGECWPHKKRARNLAPRARRINRVDDATALIKAPTVRGFATLWLTLNM